MIQATMQGKRRWALLLMALVFLGPAFFGFGSKFLEFVHFVGADEGAFTIVPIVNYVLVSAGFFLLLCWATTLGMFQDIEKPKITMLEREHELDKETAHGK